METVIGAPSSDGGKDGDDNNAMATVAPTQGQQRVYAVLSSPLFHVFVLALIVLQTIMAAIIVSDRAIGNDSSWTGPGMLILALVFLSELAARMFVARSCQFARTSYGKVDAVFVILFSLGAAMNMAGNLPFTDLIIASCVRIFRVECTLRSSTWFLSVWAREAASLLIVLPLSHLVMSTLAIMLVHPVLAADETAQYGYDIDPESFASVGGAMLHTVPYNWGLFAALIRHHPWMVIPFGANALIWAFYLGRAAVLSVKACRTTTSRERDRAEAEAFWICELQMSLVQGAELGGQTGATTSPSPPPATSQRM